MFFVYTYEESPDGVQSQLEEINANNLQEAKQLFCSKLITNAEEYAGQSCESQLNYWTKSETHWRNVVFI